MGYAGAIDALSAGRRLATLGPQGGIYPPQPCRIPVRALPLAILLLLAPAASAAEPVTVVEDPTGDLALVAAGSPTPIPGAVVSGKDIVGISVLERDQSIDITLHYTPGGNGGPANQATVSFSQGEQPYLVDLSSNDDETIGRLYRIDSAGAATLVSEIERTPTAESVAATLPRELLIDEAGAPPAPGSSLRNFKASASINAAPVTVGDAVPQAFDTAPDAEPSGEYLIQLGAASLGSARIFARSPVRLSNGEAATFVFSVTTENTGTSRNTYRLEASGVPQGIDVRVLEPLVDLAGGESRSVAVLATTPFAHQHGSFAGFGVSMEDIDDASSSSSVELGIRYHEVPQPAGHHDTLYLHAEHPQPHPVDPLVGSGAARLFMNTRDEDPQDDGQPVRAFDASATRSAFTWGIALQPALGIGLDFDTARTGALDLTFGSDTPLTGATVTAELVRTTTGGAMTLATTSASNAVDIAAGETARVQLDVKPDATADLVPYEAEAQLTLRVRMELAVPVTRLEQQAPSLYPGGSLRLPLNEYRDNLDNVLPETARAIGLTVDEAIKSRNPGDTAVFEINVQNTLTDTRTIQLRIDGLHNDWARLSRSEVRIDGGAQGKVYLIVNVPGDAYNLDSADIVVSASAGSDRSLARAVTLIDTDAEHASDPVPDIAGEAKAPGPAMGLALALAIAAMAHRRRR